MSSMLESSSSFFVVISIDSFYTFISPPIYYLNGILQSLITQVPQPLEMRIFMFFLQQNIKTGEG